MGEDMAFKKIQLFPIADKIKALQWVYAHTRESSNEKETLEQHLNKTLYYLEKICKEKAIEIIREGMYEHLRIPEGQMRTLFDEMCINTFYMHDIGKINLNFQLKKMQNKHFRGICDNDTTHALLSSVVYIEYFVQRIGEVGLIKKNAKYLRSLMILNAYVISKHHGHLGEFAKFEEDLQNLYRSDEYDKENKQLLLYNDKLYLSANKIEKLMDGVKELLGEFEQEWSAAYPYIYTKLMYSLLVACDFYATSDYMEQDKVSDIGNLIRVEKWQKAYEAGGTYQAICNYKKQKEIRPIDLKQVTNINLLRSEMFLEAYDNLLRHGEEDIFYLEAPTGSGKTNTSIQLALTLLNKQHKSKLFYVFPFNTLVEQTKRALDDAFMQNEECKASITVVNSITPIPDKKKKEGEEDEEECLNYNRMLLDRQFFHYPLVITSHVQLFNLLFGVGREDGVGLYQLVNSVIILDEVQSYKNAIWTEMISFLKAYAKLLHIKIIIMSATLPRLDKLTFAPQEITSLITEREKYFSHPLFKNRVKLDFSLLKEIDIYEKLMEKVIELGQRAEKKILVEFIKKKTAINFYNDLVERLENMNIKKKVILLTGDDSKWEREKCIRYIKDESNKEVILIATQLIEAGVDIDMDYGLKDISLLDAEEQFLGRINRSCKKTDCWAYFFNLDNATILYKGDYRREQTVTLLEESMQELLKSKNFEKYYEAIFEALKEHNEQYNSNNLEEFKKKSLQELKYGEVKKRMQLIDDDIYPCTVFLGIEIEIEEEEHKRVIDGKVVWERYIALLNNQKLPYAEKKVKLSQMREEMSCFMWKVKRLDVGYNECVGDIFYIEDGEKYMDNGKFNRESLCGSNYEMI